MLSAGGFRVPADHPCLPGHFPGRPIVPGVVLLDEALALIFVTLPGWVLEGIGAAKFLAPVPPDVEVAVEYRISPAGHLDYTCTVAGQPVLRGNARLKSIKP